MGWPAPSPIFNTRRESATEHALAKIEGREFLNVLLYPTPGHHTAVDIVETGKAPFGGFAMSLGAELSLRLIRSFLDLSAEFHYLAMARAPSGTTFSPFARSLFPIDSLKGPRLRTLPCSWIMRSFFPIGC
jgi:hypothetical protein